MIKKYIFLLLLGTATFQSTRTDNGPYLATAVTVFVSFGCAAYAYANGKMKEESGGRLALAAAGLSAIVFAFENGLKNDSKINGVNAAAFTMGSLFLTPIVWKTFKNLM